MVAGVAETVLAERAARSRRGASVCRAVLAEATARRPLDAPGKAGDAPTRGALLLQRARDRADAERRGWSEPTTRGLVCLECLTNTVEPTSETQSPSETVQQYACPCGNSWTTRWRRA